MMTSKKTLTPLALAAALLLPAGAALAESQYGYNPLGVPGVTATATVNINVRIPTLLLLKVGASNAMDTLNFTAAPSVTSAPTGATLTGHTTAVSNQAANWDGSTAPTFAAPAGQTLRASAWTNSSGGGSLALATTVNTALPGVTPAAITVAPVVVSGTLPVHPANTTTAAFPTNFARNIVHAADWTYGVSAAAGSYSQTTVYTATAL